MRQEIPPSVDYPYHPPRLDDDEFQAFIPEGIHGDGDIATAGADHRKPKGKRSLKAGANGGACEQ